MGWADWLGDSLLWMCVHDECLFFALRRLRGCSDDRSRMDTSLTSLSLPRRPRPRTAWAGRRAGCTRPCWRWAGARRRRNRPCRSYGVVCRWGKCVRRVCVRNVELHS